MARAIGRIDLGWVELEEIGSRVVDDRLELEFRTRIRRWHPGYWLAFAKALFRGLRVGVREGR